MAKKKAKAKKTRASAPRRSRAATQRAKSATATTVVVSSWEDDPGDPAVTPAPTPISTAAPNLLATPLPCKILGPHPVPSLYSPGTAEFRFFAAATALRRTSDFWGEIVGSTQRWHVGPILPVVLDDGVDLNAFYTR